jgi:hypothetical protein
MKTRQILSILSLIALSVSCGGSGGSAGEAPANVRQQEEAPVENPTLEEVQQLEGKYVAYLRPLNTVVNGWIPSGKAKFDINSENFSVDTYIEDVHESTTTLMHMQNVHVGTSCPTLADDKNGDGLIDIVEMKAVTGPILLPLDGDVESQAQGQEYYPIGKTYTYSRKAKVANMFQDLYQKDASGFAKLEIGSPLNLEGRVVMVHGTPLLARVPATVQTNSYPRNVTIPITCGIIKRL